MYSSEWKSARLRDVLVGHFSGAWGSDPGDMGPNVHVLRSTNLGHDGSIDLLSAAPRRFSTFDLSRKKCQDADLLLEASGGGPGKPVGRVALFDSNGSGREFAPSNFFRSLRADREIANPKFLFRWLHFLHGRPEIWKYQQQTTGIINLRYQDYLDQVVPLPPLREQRRIVEILDAVEGQIGKTAQVRAKRSIAVAELTRHLLDPAEEWLTLRVDEVGEVQIGRQLSPGQLNGHHMRPYLRVANVRDGHIDYSDVLQMNFTPSEFKRFSLNSGDVLLNEGQSLELVGRSAIYAGPPGMCFQNTLIRFRAREVLPVIARAVFKKWLDEGSFMKVARQTTSIAHLGAERFAAMSFPVPPQEDQERIAALIDVAEKQAQIARQERDHLIRLRAGLMEDLLVGRVRV